ncbi:hypothetical protein [Bacillus toyonensis]|uniref:hypothetical protein n=1 Tax=Bacillus toyonensis TaxID=155322 RepID=UPI002E1EA189|nr:hypothetical protein [Bacillus toyonensis]
MTKNKETKMTLEEVYATLEKHGFYDISDFIEQQQKEIKKLSSEVAVKDSFVVTFRNKNEKLEKENDALKEQLSTLKDQQCVSVPTPLGTIVALEYGDPNYPGVFISVRDKDGYSENATLVEYRSEENDLRVVNWTQEQEDYISSIKWNEDPASSDKTVEQVNQYELGKVLYRDWKQGESEASYNVVRNLGKENVNVELLKKGFIEEREKFVQDDEAEECFYAAMNEVGIDYWKE